MSSHRARAGFTMIEQVVVLGVIGVLLAIVSPMALSALGGSQRTKDSTQLREIMSAFAQFAQANRDRYPLPSTVDPEGRTYGAPFRRFSDTTGGILSICIYNQLITPELCVSPAEIGAASVMRDYKHTINGSMGATGVLDANRAVFDPRFKGTPRDEHGACGERLWGPAAMEPGVSHNSYAHACPAGARSLDWRNTRSSAHAVWAMRGPVYEDKDNPLQPWELRASPPAIGVESLTLRILGTGSEWRGNVAFADGHVVLADDPTRGEILIDYELAACDDEPSYTISYADNIFYDEPWEGRQLRERLVGERRNAYLRQWHTGIPPAEPLKDFHLRAGDGAFVYVEGDALN